MKAIEERMPPKPIRPPEDMIKKPRDVQLMADMLISDARDEIVNHAKHDGNTTIKRMTEQRERDKVEIARALLHGLTQQEIVEQLNQKRPYTLTTIKDDVREIYESWQQQYIADIETLKSRELAHVDELERAYWEAWARSTRDREETKSLLIEDKSGSVKGTTTPMYERKKVEHKKTERDGSATFLAGVQWCVEQRCKILGLEAPLKYEIDWRSEAKKAGIEPGDIFNAIVGEYVKDNEDKPSSLGGSLAEGSVAGIPEDTEN